MNFEKHAAKGNEFIHRLAIRLGDEKDRERAGRVLRCVLRALRNHLTIEESFQLMAQLPMAIKAMYVDGWVPNHTHLKTKTVDELAAEVRREDGLSSENDFPGISDALEATRAVIRTVADFVSAGELHDIVAILPREMKSHFLEWIHVP
jgi:uncharacterized protein (DUF2267 family)